ncbi:MAG: DUF4091 domain-containing protein, partial [Phycisphaerae bacterium]|nr:DUF4091 domain-containing protein [Phycisphaerae bacterium]
FAVGLESSMRKVMIRDFVFEGYCADRYALALARNEHEALQVVVIPFHAGVKNARVSVGAFQRTDGRPSAEPPRADVSLVGHVYTAENTPYAVTYRGWWPDPLLAFQKQCDVEVGEQVAFWVDVHTTAATGPGDYQASITVQADAYEPIVIRLEAHVWDIELPECTHLRTAFTYDRPGVVKIYRDRWNAELERKYHDFVLEHRLNIDHLYRRDPPDIALLEHAATKCLNAFNIMFLGNGGPGRVTEALATLETFMPAIRKSELDTFAYIYGFDEVTQDTFPAIRETFDALHARYPTLKTMTTAIDPSFGRASGLREAVDIWVPLTSWYDRDEAEALRAEGKAMWWYVCITPPHPYANWFIEYPAIEARLLLGVMSYKYQTDGFLYYLITLWGKNREPIRSGPYTEWDPATFTNRRGETANGDGSLLCPGPDGPLSTIRFENIRDGIEDYEYLYLLAEVAERVRAAQRTPQRKAFLDHAATLLAVPEAVVRTLVDYTRDPQSLYAFREAVAQAILDGRRLCEDQNSP